MYKLAIGKKINWMASKGSKCVGFGKPIWVPVMIDMLTMVCCETAFVYCIY